MTEAVNTTMVRIAASADPLPEKASALLAALRSAVPFDAAWLALADPRGREYAPLATLDLDDAVVEFLGRPGFFDARTVAVRDLDQLQVGRPHRSRGSEHLSAWSKCLATATMSGSLSIDLVAGEGRTVGLLILLFRSTSVPSRTMRRRLAGLAPALALGVDPMPSLLTASRVVRGVTAGTVLHDDGSTESLPGLDGDRLLAPDSPVVAIASRRVGDGSLYSSFLWPIGGTFAPGGHARVTVLAAPWDVPDPLVGTALMSPAHNLRGLTPRELEVLGLIVAGCSNHEIADTLIVAPRTVAAHVEHLLLKLEASSRTTAAVRAEREGLYVPTVHGVSHEEQSYGGRPT